MRKIIIEIGSGESSELFGKDLYQTDAPAEILHKATDYTYNLEEGDCAEEEFCNFVKRNGYKIIPISPLDEIEVFKAINEKF